MVSRALRCVAGLYEEIDEPGRRARRIFGASFGRRRARRDYHLRLFYARVPSHVRAREEVLVSSGAGCFAAVSG